MRKTVVFFLLSSLALLLLASPQSRGDGVDTFTLTESASGLVVTDTWQLPATPDTTGDFTTGIGFVLPGTPVNFSLDGLLLWAGPVDLTFYSAASGSGELLDAAGLFGLSGISQLYCGSEDSPTFLPGTYTGTDPLSDPSGLTATLVISAPEPSSLLLLFSALLSIAGVAFVRKLQV